MSTTKQAVKAPVKASAKPVATKAPAVKAEATKPTAAQRLAGVLALIGKSTAKPVVEADIKYGKAIALQGGGSVYINRGNADIRMTTGQAAALAKSIPNAAVRGPQGQYLRITF